MINAWDYALVLVIVSMTAFAHMLFSLGAIVVILPVLLAVLLNLGNWRFDRRDFVFFGLLLQYYLLHMVIAYSHIPDDIIDPANTRYIEFFQQWLLWIVVLCIAFLRIVSAPVLGMAWRYMAPVGLILSFSLLAISYSTYGIYDNCRVSGYVFNANVPPLFFTIFTLASFVGWAGMTRSERFLRYILVVLAIVAVALFAGSRATTLVLILCLAIVGIIIPATKGFSRRQNIVLMGAAIASGLFISFVVNGVVGCDLLDRFGLLTKAISEDAGSSISQRKLLWARAIEVIGNAPWLGYDIVMERQVSDPGWHIHNQYFSWMIWGGVLSLCSGLLFLFAPAIHALGNRNRDGLILTLAGTGVMTLSSVTDSLLYHDYVNLHYLLAISLLFGLAKAHDTRGRN